MLLFEQFNQVGVTVLIATHDLGLIARMPHRLLTLRDGSLVRGVERGDATLEQGHV
jgi:cell division transport system ATP-binding protein